MNFKTKVLVLAAVAIAAPKFLNADEIRSAKDHRVHTLSSVKKTNSSMGAQRKTVSMKKMDNAPKNAPIGGASGPNPEGQLPPLALLRRNLTWIEPNELVNRCIQGKPADRGAGLGGPKPLLSKEKHEKSKTGKSRQHLTGDNHRGYAKESQQMPMHAFYHKMV